MSETIQVLLARLPHFPAGWELPSYMTEQSAGMDLRNAGPALELQPLQRLLVPTGLAIALPEGVEAQVRPRSGLAIRRGLTLVNSPGTIDADYRGEILVPMINLDPEPQAIGHGERIAQLIVARHLRVSWSAVVELPSTARGAGGFGSTGR